jgi:hypothetical protein
MFFIFLLGVALVAVTAYVGVLLSVVPGLAEQRLGTLEDLPADLGVWTLDAPAGNAEGELVREVRHLRQTEIGLLGGGRLIRQVRYRDVKTGAIVGVEPDVIVKRRRLRPPK